MKPTPLTEKKVAKMIMRERYRRGFCLPCFTPFQWWENDVFEITGAGYWREYEIKLTLADFKADAGKERQVYPRPYGTPAVFQKKHDCLASTGAGPSEFYYVAPHGLIAPELLPDWAGLIEFHDRGDACFERTPTVRAPRRHKDKASDALKSSALTCCYWRLHSHL